MEPTPRRSAPLMWFLVILLAVLALGAAGYYYWRYQDVVRHPEKLGVQETVALVTRVGALIELPTGEEPQLVTVTDVEKIKQEQPFFANAQNGDKVLVYATAKKAFLYRPSTNKIIEVGPVTTGDELTTGTSQTGASSNATTPLSPEPSSPTSPSEPTITDPSR